MQYESLAWGMGAPAMMHKLMNN